MAVFVVFYVHHELYTLCECGVLANTAAIKQLVQALIIGVEEVSPSLFVINCQWNILGISHIRFEHFRIL